MDSILHIRVTPKASSNKIKIEELSDGTRLFRVYVTCVAENGKANKEVIKLLSKNFGLPKSAFTITHGMKSRNKIVQVVNTN